MKKPKKKKPKASKRKRSARTEKRGSSRRSRSKRKEAIAPSKSTLPSTHAAGVDPERFQELLEKLPPEFASMVTGMSSDGGLSIGNFDFVDLARELESYDAESTIAGCAGLLTVPDYQPETLRLEILLHLAVLHCRGDRRASRVDLARWLQGDLSHKQVRRLEDPSEDVFVSNILAPGGNHRMLDGIWESADHYVQDLMDCLARIPWGESHQFLLRSATALLRLSDIVLERAGLARWAVSEDTVPHDEFLADDIEIEVLAARITVRQSELEQMLEQLGLSLLDLAPFFLMQGERESLRGESVGNSTLERHPIIRFADRFLLACPTAVGAAIRRYVLESMANGEETRVLAQMLRRKQSSAVYHGALRQIDAPGAYATGLPNESLPPIRTPLRWDEVHCAIDTDKAAQVILLPDSLDDALETGLTLPIPISKVTAEELVSHVEATVNHLSKHTRGGLVVIVYGGIGRGIMLPVPRLPKHWYPVVISVANFTTYAWSPEASLLRLWKLNEQIDHAAVNGVQIFETNGALNSYAYWRGRGFELIPRDFPFPADVRGMLQIGTDFILGLRVEERTLHDVHAVAVDADGSTARVRRITRTAFFPAMETRPLFASEERASTGELAGVYEHPRLIVWVWASHPEAAPEAREFVYLLWEGVLSWLDRLVPELANSISAPSAPPVHLRIELEELPRWRGLRDASDLEVETPTAWLDKAKHTAVLKIPFGFLALLRRPENDGERALLVVAGTAIFDLLHGSAHIAPSSSGESNSERVVIRHVERAMGGPDARFIHFFEANSPTDDLAVLRSGRAAQPRFVPPEDTAAWQLGLAWTVLDRATLEIREIATSTPKGETSRPSVEQSSATDELNPEFGGKSPYEGSREILGAEVCTKVLGALVDVLWARLRDMLRDINGPSLVQLALENQEAVFQDREQWQRTARAVIALYGQADNVDRIAAERESERAKVNNASRVLIEMAVCTSPRVEGRAASLAEFESLTAGIAILIALASDSDAIRSGFAPASIAVFPNGSVACDRTFAASITNPFALESHASGFRAAAATYPELYRRRGNRGAVTDATSEAAEPTSPISRFDEVFSRAFAAEYELSPDRLLDALGELVDIGIENGTLVVSTTRGEVARRLSSSRGYSEQETRALFRMFALEPRPQWDVAPSGFGRRDWYPWRYRRRLSMVARPLVAFSGDAEAEVFFGMYQLGASLSYLLENIQSAWLPEEFFKSATMRQYRGTVADSEGTAFTQSVSSILRASGWETRTEVQMSTLGAPKELGDLDVVAWRADDDRLLLIECKRLQPARTSGEIAELLKNFRGEAGDRLGKHLARCTWVRQNPQLIVGVLSISTSVRLVEPYLVTNRDVPMRYLSDLPLAPNHVVPVDALVVRLSVHPDPQDARTG